MAFPRRRLRAWLTLSAAAIACAPVLTTNAANEEAAVRAQSAAYLAAAQRGDAAAVAGYFAANATMALANAPVVTGSSNIRATWADFLSAPNLTLSWQPTVVRIASSGDLATEAGTYEVAFDSPGGRVSDRGSYTTVWQKQDGRWIIASDIATSSIPLPTPPPAATAMVTRAAANLAWTDLEVPGFPPGLKIASLAGDPGTAGGNYTLRLMLPDGYAFPVHWHPNAENLTVVSGTFRLGMGSSMDPGAIRTYSPGDYLFIPGGMSHFGNVTGLTVVQLHGVGPFAINLGAGPRDRMGTQ